MCIAEIELTFLCLRDERSSSVLRMPPPSIKKSRKMFSRTDVSSELKALQYRYAFDHSFVELQIHINTLALHRKHENCVKQWDAFRFKNSSKVLWSKINTLSGDVQHWKWIGLKCWFSSCIIFKTFTEWMIYELKTEWIYFRRHRFVCRKKSGRTKFRTCDNVVLHVEVIHHWAI